MPSAASIIRVLIASPSDLFLEREAATEAVHDWNDLNATADGTVLLPIRWETHATPRTGMRPQDVINEELVDSSDLLVGIFWTKLGTKTGVAESGTVEEINRFVKARKPAMLYFSERKTGRKRIDRKQQRRLKRFKTATYKTALVGTFRSIDELRNLLVRDLTRRVRTMSVAKKGGQRKRRSKKATAVSIEAYRAMQNAVAAAREQVLKLEEQIKGRRKNRVLASLLMQLYQRGVSTVLNGPPPPTTDTGQWEERAARWTSEVLATMRRSGCTPEELDRIESIREFPLLRLHPDTVSSEYMSRFVARLQRVVDLAEAYGA